MVRWKVGCVKSGAIFGFPVMPLKERICYADWWAGVINAPMGKDILVL